MPIQPHQVCEHVALGVHLWSAYQATGIMVKIQVTYGVIFEFMRKNGFISDMNALQINGSAVGESVCVPRKENVIT